MTVYRQFKGYIPALDRRQVADPFVLTGRNFLLDAEGPHAAFGSDLITYERIANAWLSDTFRVQNEIFLFTTNAVFTYDVLVQTFIPVFTFPENIQEYPWTHALVGGVHYFLKRGTDIISYNPNTKAWDTVTNSVVTDPHFLTAKAGRLLIQGINDVQNSAIDDGADLATDIEKKVGIQSMAIVGGGEPLGIKPTADGFIAYTKTGALKAEVVDAATAFRFYPFTDDEEFIPLSRYCIESVGKDSHVTLTKTGLYITSGKEPQQFQPLMSEYIAHTLLPTFNLELVGTLKLTYKPDIRTFFVSVAETEQPFQFTIAYVSYLPRDEWGIMNRNHTNFGELTLQDGPFKGFNFGYFCFSGCLHAFTNFPRVEEHPDGGSGVELPANMSLFHEPYFIPARIDADVVICPTVMQMETFNPSIFIAGSGLYEYVDLVTSISPATALDIEQASVDGDPAIAKNDLNFQDGVTFPGWKLRTPTFGSIDSFIDVGLFATKTELGDVDELTLITDVALGMLEAPAGQEFEDWFLTSPEEEEDWLNDDLSDEDWGAGIFVSTDYVATIIGSLDGENVYQDQIEVMGERIGIVREEANETTGKVRYYTCYNNGFYHIIRIEALEVDKSFHLKTLDTLLKPIGHI